MKKIKFFAMALAALAIVSCSKENVNGDNEQPPVVEGVETYASFNFNVEGINSATKVASETDTDNNPEKDGIVKNITVTIFKVGTPSVLEATDTFNADVDGVIETGKPMKLTSGAKRIFVFANRTGVTGFPTLTVGKSTLEDCYTSIISPVKDGAFSLSNLTGDGYYFMSNARTASSLRTLNPNISEEASKGGTDEASKAEVNNFTFTVQRSVAKVKAKISSEAVKKITVTGTEGVPTTIATIDNLFFTVKNINTAVTPVQLFADLTIADADASNKVILPQAAYYSDFNLKSEADMKLATTYAGKYSNLNAIDQALAESTFGNTSVFATENTNARQVYGNTSYLAVKCKYIPTEVLASCDYSKLNDGSFTPVVETKPNANGDFWKVDITDLKHLGNSSAPKLTNNLFDTEDGALNLVKLVLLNDNGNYKDGTDEEKSALEAKAKTYIKKYDTGLTYYRLNIGVTTAATSNPTVPAKTTFGIKRNSAYEVNITKINKLGANSEEDLNKEPETPVTSLDTYVTATIKVEDWVTMNQEGEL